MTRRCAGQRGSVALFVVMLLPALLLASGLVLDGGRQLQARRDSHGAASAAARAAVQVSVGEARVGIDPAAATARAQRVLAGMGLSGEVTVDAGAVTVTVTEVVDNLILPGSRTVTGSASARPAQGVQGG
jgi:Flp pilus assembly protein TadG